MSFSNAHRFDYFEKKINFTARKTTISYLTLASHVTHRTDQRKFVFFNRTKKQNFVFLHFRCTRTAQRKLFSIFLSISPRFSIQINHPTMKYFIFFHTSPSTRFEQEKEYFHSFLCVLPM